jgi:hypothetical protein
LQGLQKTSNKILLSLKNIADHGLKPTSVKQLITFGKSKKVASPAQLITLTELEDILYSLDDLKRISELPLEDKTALEKELSDIYPKLPSQESFEDLFNYLQTIPDPVEQKQKFDDIMEAMNGLSANDAAALRAYKMPSKLAKKVAKERAVVASVMAKQAERKAAKTAGKTAGKMVRTVSIEGKGMHGGMHGCGMVQFSEPVVIEVSESKPKTKKAIRITGKIDKPLEFVPFGKYAIHKFKLNEGILMLRSKSNNSIAGIPPQKISPVIASVLKQVVIGGVPSFETISGLDESDKELLHKIVRLSHIELNVPTPDLTKTEQDNHRFQLLRGQLLCGNSSQEIIKELKGLLLKFIANGSIPKAQANAVLYELMVLSK